jgi:hypothetical protein
VGGTKLAVRVWDAWAAVLNPTCELDKQDTNDSRLLLAPIAFQSLWSGSHWTQIAGDEALSYGYLPPLSAAEQTRVGAQGWPPDIAAAVVMGSANLVSRRLAGLPRFGMTAEMRSRFQQRLTLWLTVRDWQAAHRFRQLIGHRIADVVETRERHPEGGILFKLALDNDQDDESIVGLIPSPR